MLQVMAVPEILGLPGGSGRWCFPKGFSKKSLAKRVLGKGLCQKGLLNRVFQKDFVKKKNLSKGLGAFSRDQSAQAVGNDPRGPPTNANRVKDYLIPN